MPIDTLASELPGLDEVEARTAVARFDPALLNYIRLGGDLTAAPATMPLSDRYTIALPGYNAQMHATLAVWFSAGSERRMLTHLLAGHNAVLPIRCFGQDMLAG
jgi:hypothetical protein